MKKKLLHNLLIIDELMQDARKFIYIKSHIENLDDDDYNYKILVENTDLLVKVLQAFSENGSKIKGV